MSSESQKSVSYVMTKSVSTHMERDVFRDFHHLHCHTNFSHHGNITNCDDIIVPIVLAKQWRTNPRFPIQGATKIVSQLD